MNEELGIMGHFVPNGLLFFSPQKRLRRRVADAKLDKQGAEKAVETNARPPQEKHLFSGTPVKNGAGASLSTASNDNHFVI